MIFAILLRVIFTKISKKYQTDKVEKTRQVSSFVFSFLFPFCFFFWFPNGRVKKSDLYCMCDSFILISSFNQMLLILRSRSPSDRSLNFSLILQKRIEKHRSSTASVGCHVAAGVFYPLEWSPCVFVHHTQLDPGTHGSMCSTVADIDQVCLIRVSFDSYRVWCFVSSMASWMTRYFPTLLVQLWCKFDAEYRIPCGDPLNWWLMR